MPFKSERQRLWLEKNKPEVAKAVQAQVIHTAKVANPMPKPKPNKKTKLPSGGFHQ